MSVLLSPSRRGTTLSELLVSVAVLSVLLGMLFVLFSQSYSGFHLLSTRQTVQGEVLQIREWLESDFGVSHLGSVGIQGRSTVVDGETVSRDTVCCLALSDWTESANYFPSGTPKWNRFIVYFATLGETGQLFRCTVRPHEISDGTAEFLTVAPMALPNAPESWASPEIIERRTLSSNVLEFDNTLQLGREALQQKVKFRRQGGRAGNGVKEVDEVFEATFHWTPANTVPRL